MLCELKLATLMMYFLPTDSVSATLAILSFSRHALYTIHSTKQFFSVKYFNQQTRKYHSKTDLPKSFRLIYKRIVYVLPTSSGNRSAEATDNYHLNNTNLADKIYAHAR